MDNKMLIGGAVLVGLAAYFVLRKKDDAAPATPAFRPPVGRSAIPESRLRMQADSSIASGGGSGMAGFGLMGLNGSGNSIATLIEQIRAREVTSGSV